MAKKRVNGEGTIGKRKDGRWEARYIAGRDPETGKQIRKSILGKTQAEVRAKLKEALAEATEIDAVKSGEYNVAGWMQAWYSLYAQQTCAKRPRATTRGISITMSSHAWVRFR